MSHKRILQIGRNCWRICRADKLAILFDGVRYSSSLNNSLPLAQQQLLILTWGIYSQQRLLPEAIKKKNHLSLTQKQILTQLLKQKPGLHVNILSWDFTQLSALQSSLQLSPLKLSPLQLSSLKLSSLKLSSMGSEWLPIYNPACKSHNRLKFNLDNQHPQGASHHQKVVVIDDALAFAGGQDLIWECQDTSHGADSNTSHDSLNESTLPIKSYHHDVQMAVAGSAAAALGSLARERWRRATREKLPLPETVSSTLWPKQLKADIEDVDVAIVRTEPAYDEYTEVREVEQLYLDSIAAARNYVYIENQFFSVASVSDALAKRLAEKNGPEVILNLPVYVDSMPWQPSQNRIQPDLLKSLCKADIHGHLAIYYPHTADDYEQPNKLHAKIMITDERFLRIGSANLNNRSMAIDTECDLAIEATGDNSRVQDVICDIRNRMLARHLDCTTDEIDQRIQKRSSLIQCIEALRSNSRSLRPLHTPSTWAD